jgi:Cys-rich four helix bundle protein (predicted Tat secretion target)
LQKKGKRMPKHLSVSRKLEQSCPSGTRRALLAGAAALLAGIGPAPPASAQRAAAKTSSHQAIIAATKRCETVGNACLKHCQRLTRLGDQSLADCMRSVTAMLPVCAAMNRLALQDAKRLKELAKVCADICRDCEAECRKHEFHHVECQRCAEACAATVKVLESL